jgi:hypothetical protein
MDRPTKKEKLPGQTRPEEAMHQEISRAPGKEDPRRGEGTHVQEKKMQKGAIPERANQPRDKQPPFCSDPAGLKKEPQDQMIRGPQDAFLRAKGGLFPLS